MKKPIFLAVFGLLVTKAASYGDGYVVFSSYVANNANGAITSIYGSDALVGVPFVAELYYAFGAVSDPVNENSIASITSAPSSAFTLYTGPNGNAAYDNSGAAVGLYGLGYFDNYIVDIPGYAGNHGNFSITFEVVAFDGTSYASSAVRGRSGSFTMDAIATAVSSPPPFLGNNGEPMPNFVAAPEPTALALIGWGGLALLMADHRKRF